MLIESPKSGILDIELMDGLQGYRIFLNMVCKKMYMCVGVEGCLFLCVCVYFIRWSRESMTPQNKNHDLKGQFCMLLLSLDLSSYRILNWGFFRSCVRVLKFRRHWGKKIKVQTCFRLPNQTSNIHGGRWRNSTCLSPLQQRMWKYLLSAEKQGPFHLQGWLDLVIFKQKEKISFRSPSWSTIMGWSALPITDSNWQAHMPCSPPVAPVR